MIATLTLYLNATPANLLVVNLLVRSYKLARDGSRQILYRAGEKDSTDARAKWVQPGRHDLFRVFSPSLAADRERPSDHPSYATSNLPGLSYPDGPTCERL